MPKQIHDVERFLEMSEDAVECRVKRTKEGVKLKLRTVRYLYTLILPPQQAQEVIGQIKCEVVETGRGSEES